MRPIVQILFVMWAVGLAALAAAAVAQQAGKEQTCEGLSYAVCGAEPECQWDVAESTCKQGTHVPAHLPPATPKPSARAVTVDCGKTFQNHASAEFSQTPSCSSGIRQKVVKMLTNNARNQAQAMARVNFICPAQCPNMSVSSWSTITPACEDPDGSPNSGDEYVYVEVVVTYVCK